MSRVQRRLAAPAFWLSSLLAASGRRDRGSVSEAPPTDGGEMGSVEVGSESATGTAPVKAGEFKFEVVVLL